MTDYTSSEDAIESMKARLLQANREEAVALNALAENWYFLRIAIEKVFVACRQQDGATPYSVFAEYQRRYRNQSALDIVMAKKESLTTLVYLKERRKIATPG